MEMSLAQKAINLALHSDWINAINVNLQILKSTPEDIDSLNRLGRAYAEIGKINLAKKSAQKVLKIDPVNPIAIRCLTKWQLFKNGNIHTKNSIFPESFLEDQGKTKIVNLIKLGDEVVIASLDPGDSVKLLPHPHSISVVTMDNKCVGKLSDDLAAKINRQIKSGIKFEVLIKSANQKQVTIFIRSNIVSFTPLEFVHHEEPPPEEIG